MSYSTVLAITLLLFTVAAVSASDPILEFGDHLFALKSYEAAITEYKRFLFFNVDHPRVSEAQFKIGLAYRAQEWWTEAAEAMIGAVQSTMETELRAERRVELAVTLIASGAYNLALLELIKVEMQSQAPQLRQRARFLRGVAYLYQFKWEQTRSVFQAYFDGIPDAAGAAAEIDTLFLAALNRPRKSERAAQLLSTLLPGLGQAYAEDWKSGLNALLLNGVLGYLTLDAAIDRDYDDALFSFSFLFYRYYVGNRYRAAQAAQAFNERENRWYVDRILQALETQFTTGKPGE